jgi:outer membrane protein OmpA-like peptidoglycan-associated protein
VLLTKRAEGLRDKLDRVEAPAKRCAPEALATAQTQLEFVSLELEQGAYTRATEHLEAAQEAWRIADVAARAPGCAAPADRDGDGLLPPVDRCPDAAEDFDGDADTDGCPEAGDRDKDGISDPSDACPDAPEDKDGVADEDGCPDVDDRDADGVLDQADKCPDTPEDKDAFEDEDGCPDLDNDQDGVPDTSDKCALQAEDYDGDTDTDGCPDLYKTIVVLNDRIELKQTIFFATAKDRILPKSFPLLNEVALALRDNPGFNVSIEGHTDSQGQGGVNQKLSQRRAESVRRYLIEQGISADRLQAIGYGEDRPIEDNRTAAGRTANRRVEFRIIKK